ncbi:MAG: ATPase [Planctomycetes bacterium]|nr:ATPase [Planctomycetota bacterium]
MYRSFTIRNFRCFQDLTLRPLERVNLIAGMNNLGKTALLEALFLHLGPNNPDLALRLDAFRGIEHLGLNPEEMWGWLFSDKRIDETIELSSLNEANERRLLRIRLVEPEEGGGVAEGRRATAPAKAEGWGTTAGGPRELRLEYQDSSGQTGVSRALITSEGTKVERARLAQLPLGVFLSPRARFPKEDAERFSNLERVGRGGQVLATAQLVEPRLRRLAVLVTSGVPMINGDIGIGVLVPVPLLGEGMGRLLSILLAIASAPGGKVLIDEIENGLHHSVMVDIWKAIGEAARRSETQVFATTHSWECIRGAHKAFAATGTYDFRLHRLERVKGQIQAGTYDREALEGALKAELEVR